MNLGDFAPNPYPLFQKAGQKLFLENCVFLSPSPTEGGKSCKGQASIFIFAVCFEKNKGNADDPDA